MQGGELDVGGQELEEVEEVGLLAVAYCDGMQLGAVELFARVTVD